MSELIVEVCCGSADDAIEAEKAGITRIEFNSCLFQGGLTPSIGSFILAREKTNLQIMSMVRPREGGFCYTEAEYEAALIDAGQLIKNGSDGIVFGFLSEDGTINTDRCREMMKVIGNRQSVFHRAIDVVPDWRTAIDTLCELKVTRILTSGQAASALEGCRTLAEMIKYARGRIEILPGGGIRRWNVNEIVRGTGCSQVHISPHKTVYDTSVSKNPAIHFGGAVYPPEDSFKAADTGAIRDICDELRHR